MNTAKSKQTYFDIQELARRWRSPIVPRKRISAFTGGLFSPEHLSNLDAVGRGPEGAFRVGRAVVYPTESLVRWLEARMAPLQRDAEGGRHASDNNERDEP